MKVYPGSLVASPRGGGNQDGKSNAQATRTLAMMKEGMTVDYKARLRRLQSAMEDTKIDSIVYGTGSSFQYFSGVIIPWQRDEGPEEPTCFLLVTREGDARILLDGEHTEVVGDTFLACDTADTRQEQIAWLRKYLLGGCVGTGRKSAPMLKQLVSEALGSVECVDGERLAEALRVCKEPEEIALLRKVASINDRVMEDLIEHIRPGTTAPQLQDLIAQLGRSHGAQGLSFPGTALFVKSGTEPSPDPFVYPREEGLVPGTSVAFDFGYLLEGYCSDYGRSFYCGEAPAHITGAYQALQEAQCHLISQMKPYQMKINEMFGVLEAALDERGYGDRLRARLADGTLGHQIGVDVHENPWIKPQSDVYLRPGMVMALEPKVWLPGEYYLRVEDIVLITEEGAESFTTFDRNLFALPV